MGLSIDTAIDIIENPTDYFPKDIEETKHFMIDTMRKYQNIKQIIKDWEDGRFSDAVGCLRVKVVLDGKID